MDRRIRSLAELSALDVPGRVIRYSSDKGRNWTYARLTGGDSAVSTPFSGPGILVIHERRNPIRRAVLARGDFTRGLIVEQAVTDDVLGRKWHDA